MEARAWELVIGTTAVDHALHQRVCGLFLLVEIVAVLCRDDGQALSTTDVPQHLYNVCVSLSIRVRDLVVLDFNDCIREPRRVGLDDPLCCIGTIHHVLLLCQPKETSSEDGDFWSIILAERG
jgi:hypothetical protein